MIAVITGDIINSRDLPTDWMATLKAALENLCGRNVKWEIFRGDSFQIETMPEDALINAFYIKACIKTLKKADVRIGIGIGSKNKTLTKITESNGEAYINSGFAFDNLKINKTNLAFKTPWESFDYDFNFMIKLALAVLDNWTVTAAEMIKCSIENKDINQEQLAQMLGRSQSSVSEGLKRALYAELMELVSRYEKKVVSLIKK